MAETHREPVLPPDATVRCTYCNQERTVGGPEVDCDGYAGVCDV